MFSKCPTQEEKTESGLFLDHDSEPTDKRNSYTAQQGRCNQGRCNEIGCNFVIYHIANFCQDCCGIDGPQDDTEAVVRKKYLLGSIEAVFGLNFCYWFQVIIHNKFCNFLFKCGCTWNWDGGWKDCNVHNAEGPRCPWCCARSNVSWTTDYMLTAFMIVTYFYLLSKRKTLIGHPLFRLIAPILVYFAVGTLVGACFLVGGYPYFIF
jgi:hypothetical protein